MRETQMSARRGPRLGLLILVACTVWLVIQNVLLLAVAMVWLDGSTIGALASALVKATAVVIAGFWTSPVVPPLFAGVALALAVRMVPSAPRQEARHG